MQERSDVRGSHVEAGERQQIPDTAGSEEIDVRHRFHVGERPAPKFHWHLDIHPSPGAEVTDQFVRQRKNVGHVLQNMRADNAIKLRIDGQVLDF